MITTTISDFRKDIKKYFDKVTEEDETIIINRVKDTGVVVISMKEYSLYQRIIKEEKLNKIKK